MMIPEFSIDTLKLNVKRITFWGLVNQSNQGQTYGKTLEEFGALLNPWRLQESQNM